jgi:hypothetical protein
MTSAMMIHLPPRSAYLCRECDIVGNCAVQCPAYASQVLMGLAGGPRRLDGGAKPVSGFRPGGLDCTDFKDGAPEICAIHNRRSVPNHIFKALRTL